MESGTAAPDGVEESESESESWTETGDEGGDDNEWESRNARSKPESRSDGWRNRSHRPRPWPFLPSSVGWSVPVRGLRSPRNPATTDA